MLKDRELQRQRLITLDPKYTIPSISNELGLQQFIIFLINRVFHESKRMQWSHYFIPKTDVTKLPIFEMKYSGN